jgi:methylenetetrahydrofolate reductase (NADPH)
VGSIDAANLTDNPAARVHMSAVAGAAFVARAGIEPTLQLAARDRNRLALSSDLLGAWALGARNVLCLSGDPIHIGDHPEATVVGDLDVLGLVRLARGLGASEDGPRYLVGVADSPLAEPYDPGRLEAKLDAGAEVVWTQIAYDLDALSAWRDVVRERGILERARVLVGVAPLFTAKGARFMHEHLPGVTVPPAIMDALDEAGADEGAVGLALTIDIVKRIAALDGVAGVHLMGLGHDDVIRDVVEATGLFPRPTGAL